MNIFLQLLNNCYNLLQADVISFFATRKSKKLMKIDENS